MKTILILAFSLALFSCGDEDPKPSFDCAKALKEAKAAESAYESSVNQHPGPNAAPYELDKHWTRVKEAKTKMEDKYKVYRDNCKG